MGILGPEHTRLVLISRVNNTGNYDVPDYVGISHNFTECNAAELIDSRGPLTMRMLISD